MQSRDSKIKIGDTSAGTKPLTGPTRSWVPRACDRCRKRKARCDESVPCRNCTEANVECTHAAPVLKRGPRPRARPQDLENRLKNLEQLISSIPAASASASLSSRELDQIRLAAHITPGSEPSPPQDDIMGPLPGWMYQPTASTSAFAMPNSGTPANFGAMEPQLDLSGFDPSMFQQSTPAPNTYEGSIMNAYTEVRPNPFPWMPPAQVAQQPQQPTPRASAPPRPSFSSSTNAAHDLRFQDSEGQTKWLGPSSGMPLLDLLKPGSSPAASPTQASLAEEWMSLSVAIGLEVDNVLVRNPPNRPVEGSYDASTDAIVNGNYNYLWDKVLEICPQDLLDNLVRAYFTISHLLWPILHAPSFMDSYNSSTSRRNPSFVALVLSICCLSCRYTQDDRLSVEDDFGETVSQKLFAMAKAVLASEASERSDLLVVQALFNLSVVQEGTSRQNLLWVYLSQALSMAIDIGLHRRTDEWATFDAVDVEVRKRTLWALYCQNIKASCTYGRPAMLRLADIDLDEPSVVDDAYISAEHGIGSQPPDRFSVVAGFIAATRMHMILERCIRRINQVDTRNISLDTFRSAISSAEPRQFTTPDELSLLPNVTDGLPGDWTFTSKTVLEPDSVRFFQKTRVFTLQNFIKLLVSRHRFAQLVENVVRGSGGEWGVETDEEQIILRQITQSAVGIIGTYSVIDARGRLGFFGAHAIAQLTQAGAGLIGVILHLRSLTTSVNDPVLNLSMQGLPAAIQVLRQLGKRRAAGVRSAELLAEFSRACRIPIFTGSLQNFNPDSNTFNMDTTTSSPSSDTLTRVEVPMLRALPRASTLSSQAATLQSNGNGVGQEQGPEEAFQSWLDMALQGSRDIWITAPEAQQP